MAKDALAEEKAKLAEEAAKSKPAEGGEQPGDGERRSSAASQPEGGSTEPYRGAMVPAFDEDARYKELLEQFKKQCEAERDEVVAAGGLKIVGTERHESRRIDNQLRGRAGRQGDPGGSRFYLSLQ